MTELVIDFTSDIEVRKADNGTRTIKGIAVPWDEVTSVAGIKESFQRGAISDFETLPLFYGHSHKDGGYPIGTVTRGETTDRGYEIEATIFDTPNANEAYAGLRGGALKAFSVGFQPVSHRNDEDITVRTAVNLREVSVVPFPAYAGATISEVRSANTDEVNTPKDKEQTMEDNFATVADVADLRSANEALQREMSVLKTRSSSTPEPADFKFTSMGDFVKRGLAGKEATTDDIDLMIRAYSGDTVSDVSGGFVPSWIDRDVKLLAQRRNILEVFSKQPLPSDGMTVTYPVFGSVTGDVAVQAAEGDNLTLIKLTVGSASANVLTYGAYSDLSRQVIERTPVSYLNKVLEAQKLSYAKVTNGAVRTLLTTTPTAYNQVTLPALASQSNAKAWVDAALAATSAIKLNSQSLSPDIWIVSASVFAKIASVYDSTGRPVFVINGDGSNTVGSVNIMDRTAYIAGLRVVVDDGLTGTDTFVVSADAITVLEDGAKFLQDQNIINLTQQFSIYGYLALTKNDVKGISRVIVPAA
jgi:HK97 family phage prohead protease